MTSAPWDGADARISYQESHTRKMPAVRNTKAVTKHRFDSVGTTALTIDIMRQNRGVIQRRPCYCGFFAQRLIVMDRRKICVTFLTVQPAVCNHSPHGYVPP